MDKRRYRIYRVVLTRDDCGRTTGTERTFCGYTYAVSKKQAANNIRFRTGKGLFFSCREGYGDSSVTCSYEAVEG